MSTEERREVKKKLRREVLARRAALTELERERGNLLITERILGHQWYYLSDTILGFVSYGSEICTTEILEMPCRMASVSMFRRWKVRKCVFYRDSIPGGIERGL